MPGYAEYFEKNRYKPKYEIGDRVRGVWNKIVFSGTVYIDSKISDDSPPTVMVHSDLPIKYDGKVVNIIRVGHKNLDFLK